MHILFLGIGWFFKSTTGIQLLLGGVISLENSVDLCVTTAKRIEKTEFPRKREEKSCIENNLLIYLLYCFDQGLGR